MGLFHKCLAAFTARDTSYPPFTNISIEGDEVVVIVRGHPTPHPSRGHMVCGVTASHHMSRAEFEKFLAEVNLNFTNSAPLTLSLDSIHAKLAGGE